MHVCVYVCCENNTSREPNNFGNITLAQDALCCAQRKAPLNFRVYFASQLSELAYSCYFRVVCCAFWNVVLSHGSGAESSKELWIEDGDRR